MGARVGKYKVGPGPVNRHWEPGLVNTKLGARAGKHKLGARVGKHKLGARAGKRKLGARVGKYKLGARAGKYKLGARARAGVQAKGRGNTITPGFYIFPYNEQPTKNEKISSASFYC